MTRATNSGRLLCRLGVAAALASSFVPSLASAELKPLWELGLGAGAIVFNDYRGADTSHAYPLPVPYFVYRGKYVQSDRDGLNTRPFGWERLQIKLSLNATPPVSQSATRQGMPRLRPTVEIGPSAVVHLWESQGERVTFDLNLPARAAFTIEESPQAIGWFFAPHVNVDFKHAFGLEGWNLGLLAGPLWADRRYHDYFYSVAPRYATLQRPAFEARGGYSGMQFLAAVSKRYDRHWIGGYVRHDRLSGAAFAASPLVKRDDYWMAGIAVTWMIAESSRMVESPE